MPNELTTYQPGSLPATMEDLAHFLLIAPEKATAMRAEIRAIQKVGLAKAVYDQKLEEQRRLCDMILDASVRLGEMTKEIPKDPGGRPTKTEDSAVHSFQPKKEAIHELGFTPKQVQRFETLADNRDLVEQEKAQAREEGRMPTRTNVLNLAQERKKQLDRKKEQIETDRRAVQAYKAAILAIFDLPAPEDLAAAILRTTDADPDLLETYLDRQSTAEARLLALRGELKCQGSRL